MKNNVLLSIIFIAFITGASVSLFFNYKNTKELEAEKYKNMEMEEWLESALSALIANSYGIRNADLEIFIGPKDSATFNPEKYKQELLVSVGVTELTINFKKDSSRAIETKVRLGSVNGLQYYLFYSPEYATPPEFSLTQYSRCKGNEIYDESNLLTNWQLIKSQEIGLDFPRTFDGVIALKDKDSLSSWQIEPFYKILEYNTSYIKKGQYYEKSKLLFKYDEDETKKANSNANKGLGIKIFNTLFEPESWKAGWYCLRIKGWACRALGLGLKDKQRKDTLQIGNTRIARKTILGILDNIYNDLKVHGIPNYRNILTGSAFTDDYRNWFDIAHGSSEEFNLSISEERRFWLYLRLMKIIISENNNCDWLSSRIDFPYLIHVINKNEK